MIAFGSESTDSDAQAERLRREARRAADGRDWAAALALFQEALELRPDVPDPDLLCGIAMAQEELGNPLQAYLFYVRCADVDDATGGSEWGVRAERGINRLLARSLGFIEVVVDVDGAAVALDGHVVGTSPIEERVAVARTFVVTVTKEGYDSWSEAVTVMPGRSASVNVTLRRSLASSSDESVDGGEPASGDSAAGSSEDVEGEDDAGGSVWDDIRSAVTGFDNRRHEIIVDAIGEFAAGASLDYTTDLFDYSYDACFEDYPSGTWCHTRELSMDSTFRVESIRPSDVYGFGVHYGYEVLEGWLALRFGFAFRTSGGGTSTGTCTLQSESWDPRFPALDSGVDCGVTGFSIFDFDLGELLLRHRWGFFRPWVGVGVGVGVAWADVSIPGVEGVDYEETDWLHPSTRSFVDTSWRLIVEGGGDIFVANAVFLYGAYHYLPLEGSRHGWSAGVGLAL